MKFSTLLPSFTLAATAFTLQVKAAAVLHDWDFDTLVDDRATDVIGGGRHHRERHA